MESANRIPTRFSAGRPGSKRGAEDKTPQRDTKFSRDDKNDLPETTAEYYTQNFGFRSVTHAAELEHRIPLCDYHRYTDDSCGRCYFPSGHVGRLSDPRACEILSKQFHDYYRPNNKNVVAKHISECGHVFKCTKCFLTPNDTRLWCTACGDDSEVAKFTPISKNGHVSKSTAVQLNKLLISSECPCGVKGNFQDMEKHDSTCHQIKECYVPNCGVTLDQFSRENHIKECMGIVEICRKGCGKNHLRTEYNNCKAMTGHFCQEVKQEHLRKLSVFIQAIESHVPGELDLHKLHKLISGNVGIATAFENHSMLTGIKLTEGIRDKFSKIIKAMGNKAVCQAALRDAINGTEGNRKEYVQVLLILSNILKDKKLWESLYYLYTEPKPKATGSDEGNDDGASFAENDDKTPDVIDLT